MFTYRDERRLFAVISVIIVAALVALIQVSAARTGATSPLSAVVTSIADFFDTVVGTSSVAVRGGLVTIGQTPHLLRENGQLRSENARLAQENARLAERLAGLHADQKLAPTLSEYAHSVEGRVVGFPPENESQSVTINKGSRDGIGRDDGVVNERGVVGRVVEATPFMSKILLITDYTSSVPAMVQRGRWWGIAKGNLTSVRLEYISQDVPLRIGDRVVTGEARSFHSGALIGVVTKIERSETGLYQSAVVTPAADLNALDRLVVIPK
ncbi:MAG: rod shape-determining protein MreC [Candidatus Eremiobacteraeota bacterium]|nr:rod shape-determining protein MreC [Candidatus Eremiobacteraeota bacterium]